MHQEVFGDELKLEAQIEPLDRKGARAKSNMQESFGESKKLSSALSQLQKMGVRLPLEEIILQLADAVDDSFWDDFVEKNTPFNYSIFKRLSDPDVRQKMAAALNWESESPCKTELKKCY